MALIWWIVLVVIGLVAVVGLVGYIGSRTVVRHNAAVATGLLEPAGQDAVEESAAMLHPGRGFGVLRLTRESLTFANGSTREVTTIPRAGIRSAGPSGDLDGAARPLKRPALVVTADDGTVMAIAVADVDRWVGLISGSRPLDA